MAKKSFAFQVKVPAQQQIDFARDLSVLLKSGITLSEASSILRGQAKTSYMKKLYSEIKESVDKGSSLSSILENSNVRMRGVLISLVKAGEVSGSLVENLSFVGDWLERNRELRNEVRSVTLYPKIVLSAAIMLGAGLALFILPKLIPVFDGMNIELPGITKFILATATFFQTYTLDIILGILIFIVIFTILSRWTPTKRILQSIYMTIPYFGEVIKAYELALFSQLMNVLIGSGLTINQAFEIAGIESKNIPYQDSFIRIKEKLLQGVGLSESLKEYPRLYPANFVSAINVGETTGTLEASFSNLSEFYNKLINVKTRSLPTVIEPILLLGIGIVVGVIALSIILPIYTLSSNLR
jgi:type IV pilus assembly protein PilC